MLWKKRSLDCPFVYPLTQSPSKGKDRNALCKWNCSEHRIMCIERVGHNFCNRKIEPKNYKVLPYLQINLINNTIFSLINFPADDRTKYRTVNLSNARQSNINVTKHLVTSLLEINVRPIYNFPISAKLLK